MQTRRSVLAVVGATVLAGCSSGGAQSTGQQSEPTNETESQADDPVLTAGEIHDDWIGVDKQAYVPAVEQGTEAYNQARENNGIHTALYQAVDTVNQQLGHRSSSYLEQHQNVVRAVDEIVSDSFQIYSTFERGKTSTYTQIDEFPVTRIWLEQDAEEDGDTIDIVAALSPETGQPTHLKNTEPEDPSTGLQELIDYRDPENFGTHGPHDIEAMQNAIEHYQENRNREYSEQGLEKGYGSWLERFDDMFWADGVAMPVMGNMDDYHNQFNSVHPELNMQMANTGKIGEGDIAAFTVEEDGPTLYTTVDGYDPEKDGRPSEDELVEQI